jgi:hypothetical protein
MSIGNYWPTWLEDSEELNDELYELTKLLVKRYRPGGDFAQENGLGNYGVRYWEMINEPNYPCCGWGPHGGQQPVNSALYAELMSEMHRAIREEAPDVFILLGGLSSAELYQDPIEFLDDIYSYGGKDAFDILAYHPYDQYQNLAATQAGLRLKMAEYGDYNKPIWITELGDPDFSTGPNGELSQVDLFDVSASQFVDMEAFFWLGMHDFTDKMKHGAFCRTINRPANRSTTTLKRLLIRFIRRSSNRWPFLKHYYSFYICRYRNYRFDLLVSLVEFRPRYG